MRQHLVLALTDRIVNLHATMLAYNKVSLIFGFLFQSTIPLVLLIPARYARRGKNARSKNPSGR